MSIRNEITLDLYPSDITFGDLREFVALTDHYADHDVVETDGDAECLSIRAEVFPAGGDAG